jgi:PhnB protein
MSVTLNPYVSFRNNAREAINFYESVFGGELAISTFADFGAAQDPADSDLVMHSVLTSPNGLTLMAADTPSSMALSETSNISISLSGAFDDDAELRGYWDKLADGGTVTMPLTAAPWGDAFGMLVDRFGITWLVNIGGKPQ